MRLIIFPLFNGDVPAIEVLHGREALHGTRGQVAVRHGMPQYRHAETRFAQDARDFAAGRALARARARGAYRDDGQP